jgi:hypothetical protein
VLDDVRLKEFVEADIQCRQLESELEYWKVQRRKHEDFLLDQMGMEAKKQAFTELGNKEWKIYTRRTSNLRVTSLEVAAHSLQELGLSAFLDYKIDTAKLGSYYKKVDNAPDIPGLEMVEVFKLYVIPKR